MGRRMHGDDEAVGKVYDSRLAHRLWTYIRPHQRLVWTGLLLLLLASAFRLCLPQIVQMAIDGYLTQGPAAAAPTSGADTLVSRPGLGFWLLCASYVGIVFADFFVRRRQMYAVEQAGQNALYDLRLHVFRHLQQLPARFFDRTPIGRLVGRVTTDIESLQEMFSSGVVTILGDMVFLVATVAILLQKNWRLTLVTMVIVPVLLGVTLAIRIRVRAAYGRMRSRLSRLNAYLHEHISGMPIVQMFVRESLARDGFQSINRELRDAQLQTVFWESTLSAIMEMLGSFTIGIILWYGGALALRGMFGDVAADVTGTLAAGLTLGQLVAFVQYMQYFFTPLNELSLKYTVMQNAMTASERIFNLLDVQDQIPEPEISATVPGVHGSIVFHDVTFGYEPSEPVLKRVTFQVSPGERVAIVGATGAGKTTIMKLLNRLYDIQDGEILLDGVDIREYGLRDLRRRIGVVPQDVFLFEGDILSNIRLGHPEITDAEAIAAADRLHMDEVVRRFSRGYREPVRERGKNLSAGEKQLIAFARVLAVQPKVLILDEATSNVDTHTEHLLQEAVHLLMAGRTSLIIAHRLSTIKDVDRILVMHKGELVEDGTHAELLERRGIYWRLYQLQYKDQEMGPAAEVGPMRHSAAS